jgi:hypothetical protein
MHHDTSWDVPLTYYQTTCKDKHGGDSQGFVLQEYHVGMWGKGVWKWVKAKTSSGRNNNASKGVDENIWKVYAVTKHECAREEPSQEEERGKSPIQLFVRVL